MISTKTALDRLLKITRKKTKETVLVEECLNRILADNLEAKHNQPPFHASTMDGYALKRQNKIEGCKFKIVGQCAAGESFKGILKYNQAIRIFTGAPIPKGANWVIIKEDVSIVKNHIVVNQTVEQNNFIRKKGSDFT